MIDIECLESIARDIRKKVIQMIYEAKSGHPGGSLSCVDLLSALYFNIMNLNVDKDGNRIDKFILSKGHAAPAYYAVLSKKGYIEEEQLLTLRKSTSNLEGHPSNKIKGVDSSSGSLGQGISIANGMALEKLTFNKEGYVYCLLGDGEMQEGQVWEAMMTAHKYNISNLILFIDNNGLQIDGSVEEVKRLDKLKEKIESFGLFTKEISGHNQEEIINAVNECKEKQVPSCIILKTIKGKGVSFMENNVIWHGKALKEDEYKQAILEIEGEL